MQDTEALLGRMADIEMPPPPDWTWLWATLLIAVLTALLAWWWRRPRARKQAAPPPPPDACSELDRLQARWRARELTDRETAYRLAVILRLGLALPRLSPQCPAPLRHEEDAWRETVALLQHARYRRDAAPIDPRLFERVRRWLATEKDEVSC